MMLITMETRHHSLKRAHRGSRCPINSLKDFLHLTYTEYNLNNTDIEVIFVLIEVSMNTSYSAHKITAEENVSEQQQTILYLKSKSILMH